MGNYIYRLIWILHIYVQLTSTLIFFRIPHCIWAASIRVSENAEKIVMYTYIFEVVMKIKIIKLFPPISITSLFLNKWTLANRARISSGKPINLFEDIAIFDFRLFSTGICLSSGKGNMYGRVDNWCQKQ